MSEIPNKIISRAVEMWCRKLYTPVFDNGDSSSNGGVGQMLATMIIQSDKEEIDDMDRRVDEFREILTSDLIARRDGDGYFPHWVDVDYHPCEVLANAADKAGIPHSQFSCKSSISIYPDKISVSFGYGAENKNHYLLPDGRWLITTLTGGKDDMRKIFDHVLNGNIMGFDVEG